MPNITDAHRQPDSQETLKLLLGNQNEIKQYIDKYGVSDQNSHDDKEFNPNARIRLLEQDL